MGRSTPRCVWFGVSLSLAIASVAEPTSAPARPSRIESDERVVFFDTYGYLSPTGDGWTLPIHAWIHEPEVSRVRRGLIAGILARKYGLRTSDRTRGNFDARIGQFLVDNERGKRIHVRIGGREHALPESAPNGHSFDLVRMPRSHVDGLARDRRASYAAVLAGDDGRRFGGTVHLIGPTGVSVVSDIDDTIKVTHVLDRARMLDQTFFQDFVAVPGMAERYRAWARRGARFHFVSSSPWQLYEPLVSFAKATGFPAATFHLKFVRATDRTLLNLFKKGTETKPAQIEPILAAYPMRKFVLVGDSGESDPEVYAALIRKHPGQIVRIYIRNITGAARDDERFSSVFAGIPAERWKLFADPTAIELPGP